MATPGGVALDVDRIVLLMGRSGLFVHGGLRFVLYACFHNDGAKCVEERLVPPRPRKQPVSLRKSDYFDGLEGYREQGLWLPSIAFVLSDQQSSVAVDVVEPDDEQIIEPQPGIACHADRSYPEVRSPDSSFGIPSLDFPGCGEQTLIFRPRPSHRDAPIHGGCHHLRRFVFNESCPACSTPQREHLVAIATQRDRGLWSLLVEFEQPLVDEIFAQHVERQPSFAALVIPSL